MTQFVKLAKKPDLVHAACVPGPLYAAMSNSMPLGWVGKNSHGEWVAWNAYGDFWTGYASTRDAALRQMQDASWLQFVRDKRAQ